jgi:hypothetical protein
MKFAELSANLVARESYAGQGEVMAQDADGKIYEIKDVRYESDLHFEGLPDSTGPTIWLLLEEQ